MTELSTQQSLAKLEQMLKKLGPVAVAVSGGVDSMTLAVVAHRLNNKSQMFHAVSPAVPDSATERVRRYAEIENWNLNLVNAHEVEDEQYRQNPINRCYFCKSNLYSTLRENTSELEQSIAIASGTNMDDLGDFRPGLKAAEEHNVVHPFVEAEIDKNKIRAIAKHLQLNDLHDLPAAPCLASRVTTGIAIDEKLLPVIDQVETMVWQDFGNALNLSAVRCRILPDKVSIQLQGEVEFSSGSSFHGSNTYIASIQSMVRSLFSEAGYAEFRTVSVDPYVKGSAFIATDGVYVA